MSFHKFIEERGPPFRACDIFDEVYASIYEQLKRENDSASAAVFEHIKELANQLLLNVRRDFFSGRMRNAEFCFVGKSITTANLHPKSTTTSAIELSTR